MSGGPGALFHERLLQRTDPRCGNPTSPEDAEALKQLEQVLKPAR
jgi:hypothetical protein